MPRPPSEPKTDFGRRLRSLRLGYGNIVKGDDDYPAKEFASELGVEAETYRSYERGDFEPPLWVLRQIRKITKRSLNSLICGEIEVADPPRQVTPTKPTHLRRMK